MDSLSKPLNTDRQTDIQFTLDQKASVENTQKPRACVDMTRLSG
ncbi:hypothetical protein [Psychroflexus aurantiacus]|nr:hypothetical protein [Psychroflexus aurantiacus]